MKFRISIFALFAAVSVTPAQNRYEQFTKKFDGAPDRAKVVGAGYLGGAGTEWLVGGGFQPDGTIVAVGTSLGPSLDIGGVKAAVLGKDAAVPDEYKPIPALDKNGQPEKNKDGSAKFKDPAWTHPNATAFVVRLSSDLKTVKSVVRFPWRAGGVTGAAVDKAGNIYFAGPATNGIAALGETAELKPSDGIEKGATAQAYLAKLNPSADKVLWIRHLKSPSGAPEVQLDAKGMVKFVSADLRTFTPEGKQESIAVIPFSRESASQAAPLSRRRLVASWRLHSARIGQARRRGQAGRHGQVGRRRRRRGVRRRRARVRGRTPLQRPDLSARRRRRRVVQRHHALRRGFVLHP